MTLHGSQPYSHRLRVILNRAGLPFHACGVDLDGAMWVQFNRGDRRTYERAKTLLAAVR